MLRIAGYEFLHCAIPRGRPTSRSSCTLTYDSRECCYRCGLVAETTEERRPWSRRCWRTSWRSSSCLARYAVGMTADDIDAVVDVFTPDGTYSAFGATYGLRDFPALVAAAPKGLFLTGTPVVELDGDTGTGYQTLCFVDQTTHDMRIGWYTDSYRRTEHGWRLQTRAMTFLRRNGGARTRARASRPDSARAEQRPGRLGRTGARGAVVELARLQGRRRRVARRRGRRARARVRGHRDARPAAAPAQQGAPPDLRRRLGAPRLARARGRPRWLQPARGPTWRRR